MRERPSELTFRLALEEDSFYLKTWLTDPEILKWFPMLDEPEIEDSVKIWCSYNKLECGLTALWNGEPCGTAVLYLQSFKKLAHTCLFSIIVSPQNRGKGIGTALLEELICLARDQFQIEILHLEVYEENPAKRLYERLGFVPFGEHKRFTLEEGKYRSKLFMQKILK